MQHDVLQKIEKEHMLVGCNATYNVTKYILSERSEDNILKDVTLADCECTLLKKGR